MARICAACNHYDSAGNEERCPECQGEMRLTFLEPQGASLADDPMAAQRALQENFQRSSRPVELSGKSRLVQIGMGVSIQSTILYYGHVLVGFAYAEVLRETQPQSFSLMILCISFGVYVLASLVGGGIAGAWCVNWMTQGVVVGVGVAAMAVLRTILGLIGSPAVQETGLLLLVVALLAIATITIALTIAGALLGHLMIRPTRLLIEEM